MWQPSHRTGRPRKKRKVGLSPEPAPQPSIETTQASMSQAHISANSTLDSLQDSLEITDLDLIALLNSSPYDSSQSPNGYLGPEYADTANSTDIAASQPTTSSVSAAFVVPNDPSYVLPSWSASESPSITNIQASPIPTAQEQTFVSSLTDPASASAASTSCITAPFDRELDSNVEEPRTVLQLSTLRNRLRDNLLGPTKGVFGSADLLTEQGRHSSQSTRGVSTASLLQQGYVAYQSAIQPVTSRKLTVLNLSSPPLLSLRIFFKGLGLSVPILGEEAKFLQNHFDQDLQEPSRCALVLYAAATLGFVLRDGQKAATTTSMRAKARSHADQILANPGELIKKDLTTILACIQGMILVAYDDYGRKDLDSARRYSKAGCDLALQYQLNLLDKPIRDAEDSSPGQGRPAGTGSNGSSNDTRNRANTFAQLGAMHKFPKDFIEDCRRTWWEVRDDFAISPLQAFPRGFCSQFTILALRFFRSTLQTSCSM